MENASPRVAFFLSSRYRLSPWDVAAGSLLVTEAGGIITRIDGSPVTFDAPGSILAGNPRAYEDALKAGIL